MPEWLGVVFESLCEHVEVTAVPEAKEGVEEDVKEGEERDDGG